MKRAVLRPLVGLCTTVIVAGLIAFTAQLFRGAFADTVDVTVLSPRAGLVMNPDARVQYRGVQIGRVASVEELGGEQAAVHLAIDADRIGIVPANVIVNITSPTVFGAKMIRLTPPPAPAAESLQPGQVLSADQVMVEINTVFEQLVSVLASIAPDKLNETLGAISSALAGKGERVGQLLSDLNVVLGRIEPELPALDRDLSSAPAVFAAYADVAPDLMSVVGNATRISDTVVSRQRDLDALLVSVTGLGELGTQVLGDNRQSLTDVVHLLVPTTDLTAQYHQALTCAVGGMQVMANNPPLKVPGVEVLAGFLWGQERYRYPGNLPKVAANGGPFCTNLPKVPYGAISPFVVTDVGANPWQYANPGIVLNSDGLKQALFGPLEGPPRNSAQIGQPG